MSEALDEMPRDGTMRRLAAAIREVKTNNADRTDVVVDLREAQQTRLEILAQDLEQVFADIPPDDERFDLNVTGGMQPRLWIDAVSHVTMGRDKRTYRFLKDTRNGRLVLAETPDIKKAADAVTRYVAERIIERDAILAGDREVPAPVVGVLDRGPAKAAFDVFTAFALFLAGAFVGVAAVIYFAWERLAISF
ncbi:hypothetical protein GTW25_17415 [Aliihoeflea aestuarii]|jgi:hypothetical protein|uniref:hypothetical protein n=1 Tax=Aliihoeflea aestuarii TaxID=453840 RepID=UPI002094D8D8|nr:hypothetical protein [Aliihoeflea aestuarii]MCO6392807.1 hypothetical protein [Aliihoeflea aestuarii]